MSFVERINYLLNNKEFADSLPKTMNLVTYHVDFYGEITRYEWVGQIIRREFDPYYVEEDENGRKSGAQFVSLNELDNHNGGFTIHCDAKSEKECFQFLYHVLTIRYERQQELLNKQVSNLEFYLNKIQNEK